MLELIGVAKSFELQASSQHVLKDISFSLARGESLAITGASGSGKSTLLALIATELGVDNGEIYLDGQKHSHLTEHEADLIRRKDIGFVYQQFNLLDSLTVKENAEFTLRLNGSSELDKAETLLEQVGLHNHGAKYPAQLSGGEQQRLAIVRALAHSPKLVLADEPTGNLDQHTSDKIARLLFSFCRDQNTALIVVTHSDQVAAMADRCLTLSDGILEDA